MKIKMTMKMKMNDAKDMEDVETVKEKSVFVARQKAAPLRPTHLARPRTRSVARHARTHEGDFDGSKCGMLTKSRTQSGQSHSSSDAEESFPHCTSTPLRRRVTLTSAGSSKTTFQASMEKVGSGRCLGAKSAGRQVTKEGEQKTRRSTARTTHATENNSDNEHLKRQNPGDRQHLATANMFA